MSGDVRAIVYLLKEGDERYKCFLTDDELVVVYLKREEHYPLDILTNIDFGHKKMLLPLVGGGILAILSFLMIFRNLFNPWLSLLALVIGTLALYAGWEGRPSLTVSTPAYEHHFLLRSISPNLKAFRKFLLNFMHNQRHQSNRLYVVLEERQMLEKGKDLHLPSGTDSFQAYTDNQFKNLQETRQEKAIEIDPMKINAPIRYQMQNNELYPFIFGPINSDAIIS